MIGRSRVTYANECLFVGYTSTGYQFRDGALTDNADPADLAARGITSRRNLPWSDPSGNFAEQLHRIQDVNYSINVPRTPVHQYGELGELDSLITSSPTVELDFSYYLTEGCNEQKLEIVINGEKNAFWHHYQIHKHNNFFDYGQYDGKNFFIETAPEFEELSTLTGSELENNPYTSTISMGNCFLTNYSIEASVGSLAVANASYEGLNVKIDTGIRNILTPALDPNGWTTPDIKFSLPDYTQSPLDDSPAAIAQGDLMVDMNGQGFSAITPSGTGNDYYDGSSALQSFQIEVPLSRTPIERLGNQAAYARPIDFPATVNMRVTALVRELKENNFINYLCESGNNITVYMYKPCHYHSAENLQMTYQLRDCQLESEQFSSAIGDNKVVDLVFSTVLAGPEETSKGIFISGRCNDGQLGLIAQETTREDLLDQENLPPESFFEMEASERD
jgi:hypothetical protein